MARKEEMSTAAKAKAARAQASGTKVINVNKQQSLGSEIVSGSNPQVGRNAKVLDRAGKVIKLTGKRSMSGELYDRKITVKKVDLDAYDLLAKKAKAVGLRGKEAETAIARALKTVSSRMTNDRQRTASRGEAIARRESKKRSGTNLG